MYSLHKISYKIISVLTAFAAMLLVAGPVQAAAKKELHVYNWSDYIDVSIIEQFTKETGITVVYDTFDSNDVLETKLLAGKTGYDVVVPSGLFLARQIELGLFQKLDKSKLPNLKYMDKNIMKNLAAFDPGNLYAVDYLWLTSGLGYNIDKIKAINPKADFTSWDILFNPEELKKYQACGVEVLDASDELIPAALNYIGEDPNSKDAKVLAKAEPILKAIRPYIRNFNSSQYINDLANGDACLTYGWSSDTLIAKDRADEANNGVHVGYSVPNKGGQLSMDTLAIPADAPNAEYAHQFINFLMDPKVIAKVTEYVNAPNGNAGSREYLPKAILDNTAIYPSPEVMAGLYAISPYDQKSQRILNKIWTAVKTD